MVMTSETTMTTKLRQAETTLRAMADELGIPTDTGTDMLEIGISGGKFWVNTITLEDESITSGKTLEEAFWTARGEEPGF
jgi:hypothetical protein